MSSALNGTAGAWNSEQESKVEVCRGMLEEGIIAVVARFVSEVGSHTLSIACCCVLRHTLS